MTIYPFYYTEYPRMHSAFPFTIDIHKVERSFPLHRHDYLEISLVIEGKGRETVNGVSHEMLPGTLTLVLPFQIHEIVTEPGHPISLYNCMFSAELLTGNHESLTGLLELLLSQEDDRPTYVQLDSTQAQLIARLFEEMLTEYDQNQLWRSVLLKAKLTETLIHIDRLRTEFHKRGIASVERGDMPASLWNVIHYMHVHYRDRLTLAGLAATFHFNTTYLSEQITRYAGKSFVHLLHEIRLRHACSLLASTQMRISDISYEVGYGSSKTLFKAFQKYKGVTPAAYRKGL
ncbi:MAG: AraC family transcriptional regulator [Candidatus Pristimantibacillus sp.]